LLGPFQEAFYDKGRVSKVLELIPIYAIMVDDLGERGACYVVLDTLLKEANKEKARQAEEQKHMEISTREKSQTTVLNTALHTLSPIMTHKHNETSVLYTKSHTLFSVPAAVHLNIVTMSVFMITALSVKLYFSQYK
jgi:hypothetical protein